MTTKTLELPCGIEKDGRIFRAAEICKLKGKVQRDVARLAAKKNPNSFEILGAILQPSVVGLGAAKTPSTVMTSMLLADRDWLLFEIVKLTRGDLVTLREVCPLDKCGEMGEYPKFDLNSLETTSLPEEASWWDGKSVLSPIQVSEMSPEELSLLKYRVFEIENPEFGIFGVFRYPTGRHQKVISSLAEHEVEALWKLMSLTCLQWQDSEREISVPPTGGFNTGFWEDMDLDHLDWAQEAYGDAMPGVNSRVDLECPSCGHEFKAAVRPSDFLFRGAHQKS